MEFWIFKVIYYPIFFMLAVMSSIVLLLMFKESGWDVPFRWICFIGLMAFIADWMVKK